MRWILPMACCSTAGSKMGSIMITCCASAVAGKPVRMLQRQALRPLFRSHASALTGENDIAKDRPQRQCAAAWGLAPVSQKMWHCQSLRYAAAALGGLVIMETPCYA